MRHPYWYGIAIAASTLLVAWFVHVNMKGQVQAAPHTALMEKLLKAPEEWQQKYAGEAEEQVALIYSVRVCLEVAAAQHKEILALQERVASLEKQNTTIAVGTSPVDAGDAQP